MVLTYFDGKSRTLTRTLGVSQNRREDSWRDNWRHCTVCNSAALTVTSTQREKNSKVIGYRLQ